MKKLIGSCFFMVAFLIVGTLAVTAYIVRIEVGTFEYETVKEYYIAKFKGELLESDKDVLKDRVSETRYKVYEEATKHNPEGDLLPDEIDDTIKDTIKEELK